MQRWIVAGVVAVMLLAGGAAFGLWTYKQNLSHPIFFVIPINPEVPEENRREIAKELQEKLHKDELLMKVAKELSLAAEWELASDQAAVAQLRDKVQVSESEGNLGQGRPPSINVNVKGKKKEKEVSGKIANRLMVDVWRILGIDPPKK